MSAEDVYRYWHLVPKEGWIPGGIKDFQIDEEDVPPTDRVLTICCRTYQSSGFSKTEHWRQIEWEHEDKELLARTVEEFGDAPERFRKWADQGHS